MTPSQRDEIKNALVQLEAQLGQEIALSKDSSRPVTLDQQSVGRVSRIDAIQQQQMSLAALRRLELRLTQVKSALLRVDTEGFGNCAKCEEEIPWARLVARPESPVCIKCARDNYA